MVYSFCCHHYYFFYINPLHSHFYTTLTITPTLSIFQTFKHPLCKCSSLFIFNNLQWLINNNNNNLNLPYPVTDKNTPISKEEICGSRIPSKKYHIFTKIDPPEVLAYYMEIFLKDNIDPLVDPFNLPDDYPDVLPPPPP